MKKKKSKWIIVAVVIGSLIGIMACGASDDTKSESTQAIKEETSSKETNTDIEKASKSEEVKEESVIVDENSIDAVPKGAKDYDEYLHLGESYKGNYGDGEVIFDIIDIDYSTIGGEITAGYSYASTTIYVAAEITNNSSSDVYFDQDDTLLFIDDYEIPKEAVVYTVQQNGYCIVNNTKQYPTVANIRAGGRKGTIVFVVMLTDSSPISETSEIDFEISGLTFKINPKFILNQLAEINRINLSDDPFIGTEYEGMTAIEQQNGTYISSDGSTVITVNETNFSAQRLGENIIDNALFTPKDSSIPNYYVLSGTGLTVTFFDGGLIVEGASYDDRGLDGYYTSNGAANTESEVTTSSSDGIGTGIVYGTYSCSPNTIGGENIAYVEFATDEDGGDIIMIDSYASDTEGMPNNFMGEMIKNGNSYSATNTLGWMLSITFVDGGMNVEVLSGDSIEEFAGYYKLKEALDLNSVG